MIRPATLDDVPQIMAWGREFLAKAGQVFDDESAEATVRGMIAEPGAVILVHDFGMIGGVTYPAFFNRAELIAQELFWWASRDGMSLLGAFEDWAKAQGVAKVRMVALQAISPERVARIYTKRGYLPLEATFERSL